MKRLLFVFIFFFLSCATTKKYEKNIMQWLGSDINELISVWGFPSYRQKMPNGNMVYSWLWVGRALITENEYEGMIKKLALDYTSGINWCRTSFVVDKNSRIINYSFDGSYCKAK